MHLRRRRRSLTRTIFRLLPQLLVAAALLAGWHAAAALGVVTPFLLPAPAVVAAAIGELAGDGTLVHHVGVSLGRVCIGFALAAAIALPLAFGLALWPSVMRPFMPQLEMLRHIPPLALIPLLILWLGIGEAQKVAIIVLASFFPIFLSTHGGVTQVDRRLIEVGMVGGMDRAAIVRRILLPAALPAILVGLRLGFGYSWRALAGAELVAASSGLGWLIVQGERLARTDIVLASIIVIGLFGLALDALGTRVMLRLAPWARAEIGGALA